MSSSVRDDDGDRERQVRRNPPPWVTDRQQQQQDRARHLADEVAAVAAHLEREALRSQMGRSGRWPEDEEQAAHADQERYPREGSLGIWSPTLEPVVMPPPPSEKAGIPGLKMMFGLAGAVGVAAGIAFALMYAVQVPSNGVTASSDGGAGRAESFAGPVLGNLTQITTAEAKVPPVEPSPSPVGALLANTQANAVAVTTPLPSAAPPMPRGDEPAQFGTAAPPPVAAPAPVATVPVAPVPVATAPEPRPTVDPLARDEILTLRRRGQDLIAVGDIASARLILTRLSEAGDAQATLLLAGTFDPAVLASQHVVGIRPDPAKARAWYAKAADQGSPEARQRLSALR